MLLFFVLLHNFIDETYKNGIAQKQIEVIHNVMDKYQAKHNLNVDNNPNDDILVEENLINSFTLKSLIKSTFLKLVFNLFIAFFVSLLIFTTVQKDKY